MWSLHGDVAIYYIDVEKVKKKKPTLLKQFNYHERGMKIGTEDSDSDSEEDTNKKSQSEPTGRGQF